MDFFGLASNGSQTNNWFETLTFTIIIIMIVKVRSVSSVVAKFCLFDIVFFSLYSRGFRASNSIVIP